MKPTVMPVLSGKNRLKIALLLEEHGLLTPTELARLLHCTQGHVSNDLTRMRSHGLVAASAEGIHTRYRLLETAAGRIDAAVRNYNTEETIIDDELLRCLIEKRTASKGPAPGMPEPAGNQQRRSAPHIFKPSIIHSLDQPTTSANFSS
ncbi:helix-turn-helix transcriptional regulator [Arthrobacter sp. S39]|uniref:ArsR/SmtB family transcription factor n=1 Tax=Arthrobacter sp. S39 TaxID=2509720 RepID=UPI00103737EB|nr:helix-turn-helix transcriptional regulator [Arthrobacter sp. S39]TAP42777.1 transcriptional regulator [Arthrobacter sp. S39]